MNITNIDDIRKLASGDEGGRTEYKLITGQLERGMETLCAFLNGEGGTVLFGVADNGKITGQEVSDKTKREIAEAIRLFEPFATITVSYANIPDTDKQVIALYAEEQRYMRPFTYKGRAYQRIESVTSVMPQDKYNHLLMQRGGKYSWEAIPNPDLQISDLDENVIIGAVRAGINCGRLPETTIREEIPAILEKFDLLHDGKLNNAAAVLFGLQSVRLSPMPVANGKVQRHKQRGIHRQPKTAREHLRAIGRCHVVFFQAPVLVG